MANGGQPLSAYARQLLMSDDAHLDITTPMLVWRQQEATGAEPGRHVDVDEVVYDLETALLGSRHEQTPNEPRPREPLAFALTGAPGAAPAEGLAVGRGAGCDVQVPHESISRVHARFTQDATTGGWSVVDLESTNGSWCGGLRMMPGRAVALEDQTWLRLGDVELLFLQPASFVAYLQGKLGMAPARSPAPASLTPEELEQLVRFHRQVTQLLPAMRDSDALTASARRVGELLTRLQGAQREG